MSRILRKQSTAVAIEDSYHDWSAGRILRHANADLLVMAKEDQGGSGIEPDSGHSTSAHGGAWYTDSGSSFWDVHSNVAEQLNGGMWFTAWDPATTHDLVVHGNFADTTNYKMVAEDSRFFGNTFVNRSAGESWPAAAMAVREGAGARASRALPEALHVCDNSTRSQVRLSGCSALPVA